MQFISTLLLVGLPLIAASPRPRVIDSRQIATADTENDLTNGSPCKAMTVIFARGTTESGNVGTLSGPPMFGALSTAVGPANLAVQGVDYGATIPQFLEGGDPTGSALMAKLVTQASTQCPNTAIVVSGYSQGGQLVHNAMKSLGAAGGAKVNSVLIFGDPLNGTAVDNIAPTKVKVICHSGDNICMQGDQILQAHLTYSSNAAEAAKFIADTAGMSGKGTPGAAAPTGSAAPKRRRAT